MSFIIKHKSIILIFLLQTIISVGFVFFRVIDADEGFYLAAAQRTADGLTLYKDFFFPQMPLLPLLFSWLSSWGLASLIILRLLSITAGLLITLQVYKIVQEHLADKSLAVSAAFLVAIAGLSLTWHSTFKPYAYVDLALIISFGCLLRVILLSRHQLLNIFLAMLFLSVAVNFRSVFIILVPFYFYLIFTKKIFQQAGNAKLILISIVALLIPALPSIILLLKSPDNFLFNNLIFHLHREPINPISALLLHKITIVGKFIALPQTLLILVLLAGSFYLTKSGLINGHPLFQYSFLMAVIIGVVYILPTPIHLQYFQQTIPYLCLAAIPAISFVTKYDKTKLLKYSGALLYLIGIFPFLYLFILSPRPEHKRFEWQQLKNVIATIESASSPQDTILSEWAGYAALTNQPQLPGSEHVGFYFPLKVADSLYEQNHLLTNNKINLALAAQRPKLVVIDYKIADKWRETLLANYELLEEIGETFIYKRKNEAI